MTTMTKTAVLNLQNDAWLKENVITIRKAFPASWRSISQLNGPVIQHALRDVVQFENEEELVDFIFELIKIGLLLLNRKKKEVMVNQHFIA